MRIAVVRRVVERMVVGEVREDVSSDGVDGRSDLMVVAVSSTLLRRFDAMFWGQLVGEESPLEDQKLYHGMVRGPCAPGAGWC